MHTFSVERHGGNRNHDWKIVLSTDSYDEAWDRLKHIYLKMRQGGVRLLNTTSGNILEERKAPRLRSRW